MRSLTKGLLFGTIGAAAAIALLHTLRRARTRQLDRFTVPVDKPGIPPQGLTILHLSDLHLRESGAIQACKLASLRQALAREPYDLLALTGDLIHDQPGLATALNFIAELRPGLAGFSCLGNHDYWETRCGASSASAPRMPDHGALLMSWKKRANCGRLWATCCATNEYMRGWLPMIFRP